MFLEFNLRILSLYPSGFSFFSLSFSVNICWTTSTLKMSFWVKYWELWAFEWTSHWFVIVISLKLNFFRDTRTISAYGFLLSCLFSFLRNLAFRQNFWFWNCFVFLFSYNLLLWALIVINVCFTFVFNYFIIG
jgi:hypothetical protein